jgi:hypothetical protein
MKRKRLPSRLALFLNGLEQKLPISISGVSKMSGPLVEVVTIGTRQTCPKCRRDLAVGDIAVKVNDSVLCKSCAFVVVNEIK